MRQKPRRITLGYAYHVINRGVERRRLFFCDDDDRRSEALLQEVHEVVPQPIKTYQLMPNPWHFSVVPTEEDQSNIPFKPDTLGAGQKEPSSAARPSDLGNHCARSAASVPRSVLRKASGTQRVLGNVQSTCESSSVAVFRYCSHQSTNCGLGDGKTYGIHLDLSYHERNVPVANSSEWLEQRVERMKGEACVTTQAQ